MLRVSCNPIKSISEIVKHPNLEVFGAGFCEIIELNFEQNNTKLKELYLEAVSLETLETIDMLEELNILHATDNQIEDIRPVMWLKNLMN